MCSLITRCPLRVQEFTVKLGARIAYPAGLMA
jgi:hypothetical protein